LRLGGPGGARVSLTAPSSPPCPHHAQRDLKPQNLLLSDATATPLVKIADVSRRAWGDGRGSRRLQRARGSADLWEGSPRSRRPAAHPLSPASRPTPATPPPQFGFARSLAPQGLAETLCGSPLYMAPEILQFQKYDAKVRGGGGGEGWRGRAGPGTRGQRRSKGPRATPRTRLSPACARRPRPTVLPLCSAPHPLPQADLWSVGTILFELLAGRPPFNGTNHVHLLRNIERADAKLPEHIAARLSAPCRALIGGLLKRNPVQRLTFEEFFGHPFLTGAGAGAAGPAAGPAAGGGDAAAAALHGVPPPAPLPLVPRPHPQLQAAAAAAAAGAAPPAAAWPPPPQDARGGDAAAAAAAPAAPAPQLQPQLQHSQGLQPARQHPLQEAAGGGASELSDSFEREYVVVDSAHSGRAPRASVLSARSDGGGGGGGGGGSASGGSSALASRAEAFLKGDAAALAAGGAAVPPDAGAAAAVRGAPQGHGAAGASGGPAATASPLDGADATGAAAVAAAGAPPPAAAPPAPITASGLLELERSVNKVALLTQFLRALLARLQVTAAPAAPQPAAEARAPAHASIFACSLAGGSVLAPAAGGGGGSGAAGGAAAAAAGGGAAAGGPLPPQVRAALVALQLLALQLVDAALLCPPDAEEAAGGGDEAAAAAPHLLAGAAPDDVRELAAVAGELVRGVDASLLAAAAGSEHGDGAGADADAGASAAGGALWQSAASHAGGGGAGGPPLPDAYGVLYDDALGSCRAAAVEELLVGGTPVVGTRYGLAQGVLLFLAVDWPELGPAAPGLPLEERLRVHRLYAAVRARAAAAGAAAAAAGGRA
jgi:hypothetical protein